MPKHLFLFCLFLFTILFSSHAQQLETHTNHDPLLSSEVLKLSLTVKNRRAPELPVFPDIHGFKKGRTILPQATRGSRRSYAYAQIYYPHLTGTFDIPAIPVSFSGKKFYTKALKGKVIEDEKIASGFQEIDFPCRMVLLHQEPVTYVGQAFQLKIALEVNQRDLKYLSIPDLSYFQKKLIQQVDHSMFEVVSVAGKELRNSPYISKREAREENIDEASSMEGYWVLGSMFLIPKRSGELDLPQFKLSLRKRWEKSQASKKERENEQHVRYYLSPFQTQPGVLRVQELPATDLPLAEIIGEFDMTGSLNKEAYLCGESIKLSIAIEGTGNLRAIPRPQIKVPEVFLQWDPISSFEMIPDLTQIKGKKTFIYELIAAKPGEYFIPPTNIYFFNPNLGAYDSTRLDSIHLAVRGEAIPQLLEINVLHNFYREALDNSKVLPPYVLPYQQELVIAGCILAIFLLILSFFNPGIRFFGKNRNQIPLSPGLKKLVENKKH